MIYVAGELFSKVEHIELFQFCVFVLSVILQKNYIATEDKNFI